MTPKKLDIFVAGFTLGFISGVSAAIIFIFAVNCFSSPSSEASAGVGDISQSGFLCATDVSGRLIGFPPSRYRPGIPKNQTGIFPDGLSPKAGDRAGGSPLATSALSIIRKAAERNGIEVGSDNWFILLAIKKQENGGPGKEFGVKGKAWGTDLDTQAAESACTVVKNRERWVEARRPGIFIEFLADRYCPKECDAVGNFNWKKNVRFWFSKFKEI